MRPNNVNARPTGAASPIPSPNHRRFQRGTGFESEPMLKPITGGVLALGGLALVGLAVLSAGLGLVPFAIGAAGAFVGLLAVWLGGGMLSELD